MIKKISKFINIPFLKEESKCLLSLINQNTQSKMYYLSYQNLKLPIFSTKIFKIFNSKHLFLHKTQQLCIRSTKPIIDFIEPEILCSLDMLLVLDKLSTWSTKVLNTPIIHLSLRSLGELSAMFTEFLREVTE